MQNFPKTSSQETRWILIELMRRYMTLQNIFYRIMFFWIHFLQIDIFSLDLKCDVLVSSENVAHRRQIERLSANITTAN